MSSDTPDPQLAGSIEAVRDPQLPDSYATRWDTARKALVVEAIENGTLRLERAMILYRMSPEEFETWREARQRRLERNVGADPHRERSLRFGRRRAPWDDEAPSPLDA